jgi:hypothetical protein
MIADATARLRLSAFPSIGISAALAQALRRLALKPSASVPITITVGDVYAISV